MVEIEYHDTRYDNYDSTDNIKNKGKKINPDLQLYLNSRENIDKLEYKF